MIERARAWVDIARHAPSGDNSQPWNVALAAAGESLTLTLGLNDATKARPSLFDYAYVASYISLGAFARNFMLLAAAEGCTLTGLREDAGRFTLTFAPGAPHPEAPDPEAPDPEATAALIRRRTTNRLPFRKDPLDPDTRQALDRLAQTDGLALREFTGDAKSRLAKVFFELDVVRYRNARLYREFLAELRFGAEAAASPDGLRDTTLGAPAPALLFLRLLRALRNVRAARALFYIGLEKVMAVVGCLMPIKQSASVFVLSTPDDTPLGWFRLGLGFQQQWLETTRRDLAMQPLGTTLLLYRLDREQRLGETSSFTPADRARLRAAAGRFAAEFGLDLSRPAIAFRVGRGPVIANESLRRPVVIHG
jgi:hypothetical protein